MGCCASVQGAQAAWDLDWDVDMEIPPAAVFLEQAVLKGSFPTYLPIFFKSSARSEKWI